MAAIGTLLGILIVAAIALGTIVKRTLFICQPNEVLIFSGGTTRLGQRRVGYKIVKGGSKIKLPLIEVVDRMDLTNMAIGVAIRGAFSNGGIPLNVEGVANVKIPGEGPILANAIERFLGKSREEVMAIAKETLEGNLRGVLARLTPEQVNEDKLEFAKLLIDEADHDLNRLGLVLDTLKIQNVSDEVGYLNSIGRIRSAEIQRDAMIAEANSHSESLVRDATNVQQTELVKISAAIRTVEADTRRRVADAQTQTAAREAEERGKITAMVVEAQEEIKVQTARVEQVKRQLEADVLEPANAQMQADINEARGLAAKIVEEGRATAETLRATTRAWKAAGTSARDVFLMQKLPILVETLTRTIQSVQVDKVTVLGLGQGDGLAAGAISTSERIKAATGIDLLGALGDRLAPRGASGGAGAGTGATARYPVTPVAPHATEGRTPTSPGASQTPHPQPAGGAAPSTPRRQG
jgi:flotillin